MALPIFQRTVVTDTGDVVSGAEVTVVLEATGLSADIYADRDGTTPLTNPFFTGSDGLAQFYAAQGAYRITASGVSGGITWRYQELIDSSVVIQNTDDIATNVADIATNAAAITANATDIATNAAAIDNKLDKAGSFLISGVATFSNSTNNINLTGIGSVGLEVGDVITVTGSGVNNKYFTVEFITDANNVVVNYEHRGGTTSKSLIDQTATITIGLISKWNVAPVGLGQGWCTPASGRAFSTTYNNYTNRVMACEVEVSNNAGTVAAVSALVLTVSDSSMRYNCTGTSALYRTTGGRLVPSNDSYSAEGDAATLTQWKELR